MDEFQKMIEIKEKLRVCMWKDFDDHDPEQPDFGARAEMVLIFLEQLGVLSFKDYNIS